MTNADSCCSLVPYFEVYPGKLDEFKQLCEQFVAQTRKEPSCLYYGFSFSGNIVHCREGYADAEGILFHLQNVQTVLEAALKISDLIRLEIHAPAAEIEKLQAPLADLNPQFFTVEYGFRK